MQRKESFLYLRRQGARELDARFARFNQRASISEIPVGQAAVELQGCGRRHRGCGGGTVKLRTREKPRDAALAAGSRTDFGRAVSCQEAKTATDPSRRGERQSTSKYIVNSEAPQ